MCSYLRLTEVCLELWKVSLVDKELTVWHRPLATQLLHHIFELHQERVAPKVVAWHVADDVAVGPPLLRVLQNVLSPMRALQGTKQKWLAFKELLLPLLQQTSLRGGGGGRYDTALAWLYSCKEPCSKVMYCAQVFV